MSWRCTSGHEGALINRGNALHELGREEEALASFDRALAVNPGNPETWKNRGITLRVLARFDDALASFDLRLALRPGDPELLTYRGHALCESRIAWPKASRFSARPHGLAIGPGQPAPPDAPPQKHRHDAEQQAWMVRSGPP